MVHWFFSRAFERFSNDFLIVSLPYLGLFREYVICFRGFGKADSRKLRAKCVCLLGLAFEDLCDEVACFMISSIQILHTTQIGIS